MLDYLKNSLVKVCDTTLNQFFFPAFSLISSEKDEAETKFLIFAQGRTGSKLLTDLLNHHPKIHCDKEIFNSSFYLGSDHLLFPYRLVNGKAKFYKNKIYGFKDKVYQIDYQSNIDDAWSFVHYLYFNNWKIIYLKRRNVFKHALSNYIAKKRGKFHAYKGGKDSEFGKIHINPKELIKRMEKRKKFQKREAKILEGLEHMNLVYEDDLNNSKNQEKTANRIFDYLGLEHVKVRTRFKKVNTRSNKDLISNYKQIEQLLKGSPYEAFLRD